jgi:hypothetical protein
VLRLIPDLMVVSHFQKDKAYLPCFVTLFDRLWLQTLTKTPLMWRHKMRRVLFCKFIGFIEKLLSGCVFFFKLITNFRYQRNDLEIENRLCIVIANNFGGQENCAHRIDRIDFNGLISHKKCANGVKSFYSQTIKIGFLTNGFRISVFVVKFVGSRWNLWVKERGPSNVLCSLFSFSCWF